MTAEPLHVQVARALGCTPEFYGDEIACACDEMVHIGGADCALARYDTDWSATGPLVEKYNLQLAPPDQYSSHWTAFVVDATPVKHVIRGVGSGPLTATCHLILALHAAGKLQAAPHIDPYYLLKALDRPWPPKP